MLKGVICEVEHCSDEFISHIFTRPKPNGKIRIILNLTKLNEFIEYEHFKMESLNTALSLMEQDCFMTSIDLKDAYYSVSVNKKFRKYLKFHWKGKLYEFTCLPMGLACAPRIFTKLLKPLFSFLRSSGFLSVYYFDDTLLIGSTVSNCLDNMNATKKLLEKAGFFINPDKSSFIPSHEIKFLGFILNSKEMTIKLPINKKAKVISLCHNLLSNPRLKIRDLSVFIGVLVSSFPGVQYGPLHYRFLDVLKTEGLRVSKGNYDAFIDLNSQAKLEVDWWIQNQLISPLAQMLRFLVGVLCITIPALEDNG